MKTKFKLTPQAYKSIVETAKTLPVLVKLNANGEPQYRKVNTYNGTTYFNFNDLSYTKNSTTKSEPVTVNHEVELCKDYGQYGDAGIQKYIQVINEINNQSKI